MEDLLETAATQDVAGTPAPVVEVASHDHRRLGRHFIAHHGTQQFELAAPVPFAQTRGAHTPRAIAGPRAADPARSEACRVVRAREPRCHGSRARRSEIWIAPHCRGRRADRPHFAHRRSRPRSRRPGIRSAATPDSSSTGWSASGATLHLLEKHHVSRHLTHRLAQVMQDEAPVERREALVRVHGQNPHGQCLKTPCRFGSSGGFGNGLVVAECSHSTFVASDPSHRCRTGRTNAVAARPRLDRIGNRGSLESVHRATARMPGR